jgi:oxaloacetate decarboxylase beta subunit
MLEAMIDGLSGLGAGVAHLHWSNPVMIGTGCLMLYLAIAKGIEPLLLVPIGFGAVLVNIPLAGLMEADRFRHRGIEFRRNRFIRYIRVAARSQVK